MPLITRVPVGADDTFLLEGSGETGSLKIVAGTLRFNTGGNTPTVKSLVDSTAATITTTTAYILGTADTSGIRLDLESGSLAVREGDDSAYAPLNTGAIVATSTVTATTAYIVGVADTTGIRLDLESGSLAVREGDDTAYGQLNAGAVVGSLGTITSDNQSFTGTATWNNAGVTFTASRINVTDTASNAASLLADFQVGGVSKLAIRKTGSVVVDNAASWIWTSRGSISASADGAFQLADTAGTSFGRLMFGGTTSSFPALKRSSAVLQVRLADDSADANLAAAAVTGSGAITSTGATAGVGYATGAGGTVVQATSKATGVTLSKVTGEITMNAASLAADTTVSFTLTNTAVAVGDHVHVDHVSAGTAAAYITTATAAAGSATINVHNATPAALAEAIVLKFTVFKAVTA